MERDADSEWLTDLMAVYRQASPTIETVAKVDSAGQPATLDGLVEGRSLLSPLLESVKSMQRPSAKQLRKAKGDLEKTLEMSIKAGEMALKMTDDLAHGSRTAARMHSSSIVGYVNYAGIYHQSLQDRLAKIGVKLS